MFAHARNGTQSSRLLRRAAQAADLERVGSAYSCIEASEFAIEKAEFSRMSPPVVAQEQLDFEETRTFSVEVDEALFLSFVMQVLLAFFMFGFLCCARCGAAFQDPRAKVMKAAAFVLGRCR